MRTPPPVLIDNTNKETEKKEEPFKMVDVQMLDEYSGSVTNLLNK